VNWPRPAPARDTLDLSLSAVAQPTREQPEPEERFRGLVNDLIDMSIILGEEWDELDSAVQREVCSAPSQAAVMDKLVSLHLLSRYQADTINKGCARDLLIGHYRILGVLGRGGMGVVYRAENVHLRREVAVKVYATGHDASSRLVRRFYAEARAAARLHHPNLVPVLDAGRYRSPEPAAPTRDYYVMELVNGQDLDALIRNGGPLPVQRACDLFRQVADALAEAHRHGLVHRDIKPGNILITPDNQAKVLDFGLALHPHGRMTEPGTLLGTVGYMAPEQARDPHSVDHRADLFSLGATMYWALTGREPYPETGNPLQDITNRFTAPPPLISQRRPELPEDLTNLVTQMLHTDPDARPPTARVVAVTLTGLSKWTPPRPAAGPAGGKPRVVVVDDEPSLRALLRAYLSDEFAVAEAGSGEELRAVLKNQSADLLVMDIHLPGESGCELVESIRAQDGPQPLILLTSGVIPPESLGGLLSTGADDFLAKPFSRAELRSRVRGLLGRKAGDQARAAAVTQRVGMAELTRTAATPPPPAIPADSHGGRLNLLTGVFGQVLHETLGFERKYGSRLGRYVRTLATAVKAAGEYDRLRDSRFLDLLAAVAPLHDIGMIALPQAILRKPGNIDSQERMVIQTHTVIGSEWVVAAAELHPESMPALSLAGEVIRSHHERWDGTGYPDQLAGPEIPLAARVVGLAATYDALRSRRAFRPALSHARVTRMLLNENEGQFDPALLAALADCAPRFEKIFLSSPD
jgi:response regulator RpfG family c-di-GMP phosphodiesterase